MLDYGLKCRRTGQGVLVFASLSLLFNEDAAEAAISIDGTHTRTRMLTCTHVRTRTRRHVYRYVCGYVRRHM